MQGRKESMQNHAQSTGGTAASSHGVDNRSRLSMLAERLPRGTKIDMGRVLEAQLSIQAQEEKFGSVIYRMRLMSLAPCWAGSLCMGTALGYSLPAGRSLSLARDQGTMEITHRQIFWFGSLMTLGAVFGSLGGALLTQRCGRRWSLVIAALGLLASWMGVMWARHLSELVTARFVNGLFTGLVSLVVPAHIAEMAVVSERGTDGAVHQLAITLGILYAYVFGCFLDWTWLALCCALPAVLLLPAGWLLVESPRWLLQMEDKKQALAAVTSVRAAKTQADLEFEGIQAVFPKYRTPLAHYMVALLVMCTQQMSGVNSIIISTTSIDPGPDFSVAPMGSVAVLALLQCLATAGAAPFLDIAGRRRLLGLSVVVCSVSLALLAATYYYLAEEPPASEGKTAWMVPMDEAEPVARDRSRQLDNPFTVVLKAIFVAGFSAGLGPVPWILAAELTPLRGSGLEFGTVCAANWAGSFVTANIFASTGTTMVLVESLLVYSGMTITGGALIFAFLPETANLSIEGILMLKAEKAVRKRKSKEDATVAPLPGAVASKKEDAGSTSRPPPSIKQQRPADAQPISKAPDEKIASEDPQHHGRLGTRSPSVQSRRSMASEARSCLTTRGRAGEQGSRSKKGDIPQPRQENE